MFFMPQELNTYQNVQQNETNTEATGMAGRPERNRFR